MTHTTIIAEAGVNHNGSLSMALQLVDAAADAGADIVKFQTFKAKNLVTQQAQKAQYQIDNMVDDEHSQLRMLQRLELSENDHRVIIDHCRERGIKFLSTPFDLESLDFLHSLGLDTWKIPSGDITNYFLLSRIAGLNQEVILSTGMSTLEEIRETLSLMAVNGQDLKKVTLLHCTTQYPTPMQDVNLRAMGLLHDSFRLPVGYSDHTKGIEVPVAAVALGAKIIEKHFTLDRDLPGPDHKASLTPDELHQMVTSIRNIEVALGQRRKYVTNSEMANRAVARKSLVATRLIKGGEVFSTDNVGAKRPGSGISPMLWPKIDGLTAQHDYLPDQPIDSL